MAIWVVGLILNVIGAGLIIVGGGLLWRWRQVAGELQTLSAQAGASNEQERKALAQAQTMLLTVEVLNPLELARAHSRVGSSLAGVAPGLVRKRVYQTVANELREELAERGVQANIEIHKAGG